VTAPTVRAGIITGVESFELLDFPVVAVGPTQVRVAISLCGVCVAEVKAYRSGHGHGPSLCGHEWAGTVAEVGAGVDSLAVGDRVAVAIPAPCGRCESCRGGGPDFCAAVMAVARGRADDAPGYGGFARWVTVGEQRVMRVDPRLSDVEAAMIEPATVAGHAAMRGNIGLGANVIVVGAGPIGLFVSQWARAAGAGRVIVVEPEAARRTLALKLGADDVFVPGPAIPADADVVFECVGEGDSVETAVGLVRPGGRVVLLGDAAVSSIAPRMWLAKEVDVVASAGYSRRDFERTNAFMAAGRLQAEPLHSRTIQLDDLPATLRSLAGETIDDIKVLVDPR
jgi:2-desacetyl-2-hydroxyethyl bacteriochlorophyllide A dehydrogenase